MKAFTNWTNRNPLISLLGGALFAVALWAAWTWDTNDSRVAQAVWAADTRS